MLQELDRHWREHLAAMDYLRQGIHLRAYAQKNPKQEYKREAFELFGALLDRIKHDTISLLSRLQVRTEAEIEEQERERERQLARKLQIAARRRRSRCSSSDAAPVAGVRRAPAAASRRRRLRGGRAGAAARPGPPEQPDRARRPQGRSQRAVPVRLGQEVQALPRPAREGSVSSPRDASRRERSRSPVRAILVTDRFRHRFTSSPACSTTSAAAS